MCIINFSYMFPVLLCHHALFGFSSDELCLTPWIFVYLHNVCKFVIWRSRNDFHFRHVRLSATSVIVMVKTCVRFNLLLFFWRFKTPSSVGCSWSYCFCFCWPVVPKYLNLVVLFFLFCRVLHVLPCDVSLFLLSYFVVCVGLWVWEFCFKVGGVRFPSEIGELAMLWMRLSVGGLCTSRKGARLSTFNMA